METLTDYKCCCQLSSSPSLTFPCVWRGCIYSVYLDGLSHLCPVCSEGFEESYLICDFLLSICTWGFVFTILCYSLFCFLFFLFERNYWKIVFYLLLFFIWNISILFSIVAIYARMEIPCTLYFSLLLWIAVTAPCWRQSCACVLSHSVVSDSLWPQGL